MNNVSKRVCIVFVGLLALALVGAATALGYRAPTGPTAAQGKLIVDGQFLDAPYHIDFDDTQLTVNGIELAKVTVVEEERLEDLSTDTAHGLIRHAFSRHASIKAVAGKVEALEAALAMLQESSLIDSAAPAGPDAIEVFFKGEPYPETLSFKTRSKSEFSVGAQQRFLRERGETIAMLLGEDRLVALQGGILVATEPGTASTRAADLRAAATASLTATQRREAVARLIPDARVARFIADAMTAEKEVSP